MRLPRPEMVTTRRRIWCEFVTNDQLQSPETIELLQKWEVSPIIAVYPHQLAQLSTLTSVYKNKGIEFDLWPMLSDEDGRWLNVHNVDHFSSYVRDIIRQSERFGALPHRILFDLEPSIPSLRAIVQEHGSKRLTALRSWFEQSAKGRKPGTQKIRNLIRDIRDRGIGTEATILPVILGDRAFNYGWEAMLGTPAHRIPFDGYNVMLYTSLFENYAIRWLKRKDARYLLAELAIDARKHFGAKTSISLGIVGPGALGDEPTYAHLDQLSDDVGICKSAGVDDLIVHGLSGVLSRGAGEWLKAFTDSPRVQEFPPTTIRGNLLLNCARLSSYPLAWAARRLAAR